MATSAFNYVTADKSDLYRAVMGAFAASKAHFVVHLRPEDVAGRLGDPPPWSAEEVQAALDQLVAWGNLLSQPDTGRVTTVEDFYRARHLYQLSREGEAAEAALAAFDALLGRRGALQAVALEDIRDRLRSLARVAGQPAPDPGEVHALLRELGGVFTDLAENAQAFMAGLGRTLDLRRVEREAFLAYKARIIEYLKRFLGDLVVLSAEIARLITALDRPVQRLLAMAAERESRDAAPDPEPDTPDAPCTPASRRAQALAHWQGHWQGLRHWFIGTRRRPSQSALLQSAARRSISALLEAVVQLNERRLGRSDRAADFRTLARWFMECPDEAEAHRLWRAAFGLAPARHLFIDADTLAARAGEPQSAQASWWSAAPMVVNPRLRATGSYARRGPPAKVHDRRRDRERLARALARESDEARAARRRLATGEDSRLSAIGELDEASFRYLLRLLGEALAAAPGPAASVETVTGDGAVAIRLEPLAPGSRAVIRTPVGIFSGRDYRVRIRDLEAGP